MSAGTAAPNTAMPDPKRQREAMRLAIEAAAAIHSNGGDAEVVKVPAAIAMAFKGDDLEEALAGEEGDDEWSLLPWEQLELAEDAGEGVLLHFGSAQYLLREYRPKGLDAAKPTILREGTKGKKVLTEATYQYVISGEVRVMVGIKAQNLRKIEAAEQDVLRGHILNGALERLSFRHAARSHNDLEDPPTNFHFRLTDIKAIRAEESDE